MVATSTAIIIIDTLPHPHFFFLPSTSLPPFFLFLLFLFFKRFFFTHKDIL